MRRCELEEIQPDVAQIKPDALGVAHAGEVDGAEVAGIAVGRSLVDGKLGFELGIDAALKSGIRVGCGCRDGLFRSDCRLARNWSRRAS